MSRRSIIRVFHRFSRRVGVPVAVFVLATSLVSQVASFIGLARQDSASSSQTLLSAKQQYEAPSLSLFAGDAYAGGVPPAPPSG